MQRRSGLSILILLTIGLSAGIYFYQMKKDNSHPRAIIAFTDREAVSEDWSNFYADIRSACAPTDIQVAYANRETDKVLLGEGASAVEFDLRDFRKQQQGYVFVNGKGKAKFVAYNLSSEVLAAASEFFGESLAQ